MPKNETTNELLAEWHQSAMDTIRTLHEFGYLMRVWRRFPPDRKRFMAMVKMMTDQGLEGWLNAHPLGLDDLAVALSATDID